MAATLGLDDSATRGSRAMLGTLATHELTGHDVIAVEESLDFIDVPTRDVDAVMHHQQVLGAELLCKSWAMDTTVAALRLSAGGRSSCTASRAIAWRTGPIRLVSRTTAAGGWRRSVPCRLHLPAMAW